MKKDVVQVRIEPALGALIQKAVQETGLTRSEVLRQGLRRGVPQMLRAPIGRPRQTLFEALQRFKGLEIPDRYYPHGRRK